MCEGTRIALAAIAAIGLACIGCGDSSPSDPQTKPKALLSLSLSPATASLEVGQQQTFTATGSFDDGSTAALNTHPGLTWASSAPAVATVIGGAVTAVAEGTSTITATLDGTSAKVDVTVAEAFTGLVVFDDGFAAGLSFAPFGGSTTDLSVDSTTMHRGKASLALKVPASGYAGGALRAGAATDLSRFNAVTFWAKASQAAKLDVVGVGNSAESTALQAEWNAVPLTTEWTRFVVPLPLPAKLTAESGLFHFAEGASEGAYTIWFDDIRYESVDVGAPAPVIATEALSRQVGDSFPVHGVAASFTVGGSSMVIATARGYFTYTSSDPAVATVDASGQVVAVGIGSATITAKLGTIDATGALSVTVTAVTAPTVPAPAPTAAAADVIALFSDAYTAVPVDTWRTDWSDGTVSDVDIGTDHVKKYANLNYAGIEFFRTAPVDATAMTTFHLDVWIPDAATIRVKLVDFGANGHYDPPGGDDVEHELSFNATSTPILTPGAWVGLDVPLASFTNLTTRAHLSQLIVSSTPSSSVYVDNVYFHRPPTAP